MANNFFRWITVFLLCITTVQFSVAKKSKLKVGDTAPGFVLQGDDGKNYKLSDFKNQKVVLFFYPLDDSAQCTKEACSLAQGFPQYKKNNIQLFGINHESIKSHTKFKKKHNLPFILLSDPSCAVIKAYGAYSALFIKRITFLIDHGKIVSILRDIDVHNHADQIIKAFNLK